MTIKNPQILDHLTEAFIIETITDIGNALLTKTSHNFHNYGAISISEATIKSHDNYNMQAQKMPAVALMEVILAANRDYNRHVLPNIRRIKNDHPDFISFDDLRKLIDSMSINEFYSFWGPRDEKKYRTLQAVLNAFHELRSIYPKGNDYEVMNFWATHIDLKQYQKDPIGKIPNIAIATVQHLRMVFGANTVKPDQRVIEVLKNKFGLEKINQLRSILYIEQMSAISGLPTLLLDQYFVLYGSGYYNKNERITLLETRNDIAREIALKLQALNVSVDIIYQATKIDLNIP